MSKQLCPFNRLPPEMTMKIMNFSNTESKVAVRGVSRYCKSIVEVLPMHYEHLFITCSSFDSEVRLQIREKMKKITYTKTEDGYKVQTGTQSIAMPVKNKKHYEAAIPQFMKVLQNPKAFLEKLTVSFFPSEGEVAVKTREALAALGHKLSVRWLEVVCFGRIDEKLHVLPFLDADVLEKLTISVSVFFTLKTISDEDYERLATLEQWKKAKKLVLKGYLLPKVLERTKHFKEVQCITEGWKLEDVLYILDNMLSPDGWDLRSLKWRDFDEQEFVDYVTGPDMKQYLGPSCKITVEQGPLGGRGLQTLKVTIKRGTRRCVIELEEVDSTYSYFFMWISSVGRRRVYFRNPDAPKTPLPLYKWEKERMRVAQEVARRRAIQSGEAKKQQQEMEYWTGRRDNEISEMKERRRQQKLSQKSTQHNANRCNFSKNKGGRR